MTFDDLFNNHAGRKHDWGKGKSIIIEIEKGVIEIEFLRDDELDGKYFISNTPSDWPEESENYEFDDFESALSHLISVVVKIREKSDAAFNMLKDYVA